MLEKIMNLKSMACSLIKGIVSDESGSYKVCLSNGEKQNLNRLISLVDAYILTDIEKEAQKNSLPIDSYMLIKLLEINTVFKGYDNKHTVNIVKLLDNVNIK